MRKPVSPIVVALSLVVGLIVAAPGASAETFPPNPLDPASGERNLLDIIDSLLLNEIKSALDPLRAADSHFMSPIDGWSMLYQSGGSERNYEAS